MLDPEAPSPETQYGEFTLLGFHQTIDRLKANSYILQPKLARALMSILRCTERIYGGAPPRLSPGLNSLSSCIAFLGMYPATATDSTAGMGEVAQRCSSGEARRRSGLSSCRSSSRARPPT